MSPDPFGFSMQHLCQLRFRDACMHYLVLFGIFDLVS